MSNKIKIFFTFLAVTAIISVFSFFDVFKGVRSADNIHEAAIPLLPLSEDADQDGLSDSDEAYWNTDFQNPDTDGDGFLDGEEVISERDPREAAGDDAIDDTVYGVVEPVNLSPEELNVTDNITEMLAGAISEGDLGRGVSEDKTNQSLNVLSNFALNNFFMNQSYGELPPANIVDDEKENQVKYLELLADVIKLNLIGNPPVDPTKDLATQTELFKTLNQNYKNSIDKISLLSVPKSWVQIHERILDLLSRFIVSTNAISLYEADIIKAYFSFNELGALNNEAKSILKDIQVQIRTTGLSPQNEIFEIMDIIYKY